MQNQVVSNALTRPEGLRAERRRPSGSAVTPLRSWLAARPAANRVESFCCLQGYAIEPRTFVLRMCRAHPWRLAALAAANAVVAANRDDCRSDRGRAKLRRSGHIGAKPTGVPGAGWTRGTRCGLLQYLLAHLANSQDDRRSLSTSLRVRGSRVQLIRGQSNPGKDSFASSLSAIRHDASR